MHPCLSHFTQRLSDRRDPRVRQQMNERAVISQQSGTVWRRKLCHVQYGWTGGTVLTGANQPRETDALWLHWHRSAGRADPEKAGRRGSELGFMGHSRGPERWLRCVPVTPGPRGGQVDPGALGSASLASHQVLATVRDLTAGGELFRQILDIDLWPLQKWAQLCTPPSSAEWTTLGWRHGSVVKRTCSSKGLEFVPSTHVGQLTTFCNSSSRGLMTSSGFYRHLHEQAHTHRQTDTTQTDRRHTIKNKANLQNMLLNYTLNFFQR